MLCLILAATLILNNYGLIIKKHLYTRMYITSIFLLLLIYLIAYKDSEGVNNYPYVPRRYYNSGIRYKITQLSLYLLILGNCILTYTKNMEYKKRKCIFRSSCSNLTRNNNKYRIMIVAFTTMACQIQKTHWEQWVSFDTDSFDIGVDN